MTETANSVIPGTRLLSWNRYLCQHATLQAAKE